MATLKTIVTMDYITHPCMSSILLMAKKYSVTNNIFFT